MVRKDQVRYHRWCDGFHRFAHPFTFLLSMLTALFDSYRQASKFLQYTLKSFLQDCKGMRQCPEERNSLIYDVMFSEYHKRNPGRPPVAAHPHQPSSGYLDKGSDTGYPGKDSRYSDKGSVAGYSSKGPAAGYTSGYSDKGQATGYHSGYSGKQSSAWVPLRVFGQGIGRRVPQKWSTGSSTTLQRWGTTWSRPHSRVLWQWGIVICRGQSELPDGEIENYGYGR